MNMSYCRFENTVRDLIDCREALFDMKAEGGEGALSRTELSSAKGLVLQCFELLEELKDLQVGSDYESMDDVPPEAWSSWVDDLNEQAKAREEEDQEDDA